MAAEAVTIVLVQDKVTTHTVRFASKDDEAPITQVYVDRTWAEKIPEPRSIAIKLEPIVQ